MSLCVSLRSCWPVNTNSLRRLPLDLPSVHRSSPEKTDKRPRSPPDRCTLLCSTGTHLQSYLHYLRATPWGLGPSLRGGEATAERLLLLAAAKFLCCVCVSVRPASTLGARLFLISLLSPPRLPSPIPRPLPPYIYIYISLSCSTPLSTSTHPSSFRLISLVPAHLQCRRSVTASEVKSLDARNSSIRDAP